MRRKPSYRSYTRKLLIQYHADLTITDSAKQVIEGLVLDILQRIVKETADRIVPTTTRKGVQRSDIETAVRLVLPREMADYALKAVSSAAKKYTSYKRGSRVESDSAKAGLIFPVSRMKRLLETRFPVVSPHAAVALAAAVEYVVAEVVDQSGECALQQKRRSVTSRCVMLAIRGDDEGLSALFPGRV
jgi:histone H3/H4